MSHTAQNVALILFGVGAALVLLAMLVVWIRMEDIEPFDESWLNAEKKVVGPPPIILDFSSQPRCRSIYVPLPVPPTMLADEAIELLANIVFYKKVIELDWREEGTRATEWRDDAIEEIKKQIRAYVLSGDIVDDCEFVGKYDEADIIEDAKNEAIERRFDADREEGLP